MSTSPHFQEWLQEQIDDAVAAEREACARVAEDMLRLEDPDNYAPGLIAERIRARGEARP